jgi:hypothetical protein
LGWVRKQVFGDRIPIGKLCFDVSATTHSVIGSPFCGKRKVRPSAEIRTTNLFFSIHVDFFTLYRPNLFFHIVDEYIKTGRMNPIHFGLIDLPPAVNLQD